VKFATTTLAFCVAALLSLGMVMLYSSSMADKNSSHFLVMQLAWCGLGLVACVAGASLDYRILKKLAWPLLAVALVLLALVFVPQVGVKVNGARRWIGWKSVSAIRFQSSELAKIALIIVVAWYGDRFQRKMGSWRHGILLPGLFIAPVLGLIFFEPDRGTTILMAAVAGIMLLIAGVRWKFIVPPMLAGAAAFGFSLLFDPMRTKRIFAWLDVEKHKMDIGYQAYGAMLALGTGGWTGSGLGNSRQKLGFLPEHNTDFIFSIIGEELGLVATLLVVLAFVVIVICGIYIAWNAPDTFGLLLGAGVTFLIGLQACINIGVVTSALPNKGLPLPFISYGGSNLLMMLAGIGLLLSIARKARGAEIVAGKELEPDGIAAPQLT
jgi:cell division protein FtsW